MDTAEAVKAAMAAAAGEPPPVPSVPAHHHWLLRLPPVFWSRMHLYLDYIDILNLALLSTQFRQGRLEEYLSWNVRLAVVAQRERALSGRGRCACYLCFRIRDIEEFAASAETVTFARVLQRNAYTGRRLFEAGAPPPPPPSSPGWGGGGGVAGPPPTPTSPMGSVGGVGSVGNMGGGIFAAGIGMTVLNVTVGGVGGVPGGLGTVQIRHRPRWTPRAPGAEVGQIESLRRYCIDCAVQTHLSVPGDVMTSRVGVRLWVCQCRVAHAQSANAPCPICNMGPVFHARAEF